MSAVRIIEGNKKENNRKIRIISSDNIRSLCLRQPIIMQMASIKKQYKLSHTWRIKVLAINYIHVTRR